MAKKSKFGSKEAGSKGGKARAKRLSSTERSEIARQAALRRWNKDQRVQQATHDGVLQIGTLEIPCAVLEDGTRVLTQFGFLQAVGRSGRPAGGRGSSFERRAPFLDSDNLIPFIDESMMSDSKAITFKMTSGGIAHGYRADLLPRVCEIYLQARDANALRADQIKFSKACDIIMRGLAHVGIIALVDEATGFQTDRAKRALAEILERFISDELRRWVKTFPDDYFKELCRLKGVEFRSDMKLPMYFGVLTNNIVYKRLAPGVLNELQRVTPKTAGGGRKHKFHQRLSSDIGHPKLLEHLGMVIGAMKLSDNFKDFKMKLDRIAPVYKDAPLFEGQS